MFGRKKHSVIEITQATKNDLKNFRELFFEFQQHHYKARADFFINPKIIDISMENYLETIQQNEREVIFAKIGDLAVGMLVVTVLPVPVGDLQYPRSRPTIEILVVRPKYRKLGIAAQLVEWAESWAREKKHSEIVSDVWTFGDSAGKFFNREGFRVKTQRFYKNLCMLLIFSHFFDQLVEII